MGFTTIGLMLGYGCNAECRSCMWGESRNRGPSMSIQDACEWIDQAHALGNLMLVGFSGGEPFLYLDEMKAVAGYAKSKYQLPSVAATNAWWAKTTAAAEETLASLYELGLRMLLISVDDFHQEWVPLERVKNCLEAARLFGIDCTLQCVVTTSSHKLSYYKEALSITAESTVKASEIPCTPVGSAAMTLPSSDFPLHPGVPCDYCTLLQALIVRPEGTVHLCCGPAFITDPLKAGDLRNETLKSIIDRAEWNPLYNALALGNGPAKLAEALIETGHGDFLLEGYTSACHACHHILRQPGIEEILRTQLEPQQAELFLKRTILDQMTTDREADLLKI